MSSRKFSQAHTQDEGFFSMEAGPSSRNDESINTSASFVQSSQSQSVRKNFSRNSDCYNIGNAYAGVIRKFTVKNFMCHAHLSFEFNPKSNFIIGKNGSGKSAIQTAICIALGANAKATNRAGSLNKLIKNGCSSAFIELVLSNQGERSFKHHLFGDHIIVTRTINESGASSFKLKSEKGVVISTKKEDLVNMTYFLQIQIANPISILNQDSARTFFAATNASKKYEFFVKGTQIDEMHDLITQIIDHKNAIEENIQTRTAEKESVAGELKELEKKKEIMDKVKDYQEKRDMLELEFLWAEVHKCQADIQEQETNLANQKVQFEDLQESVKQKSEQEQKIIEKIEELRQILNDQKNKIKEYNDACQLKRDNFRNLKKTCFTKEHELVSLNRDLDKKKTDLSETKEEILRLESSATQKDDKALELRRRRQLLEDTLKSLNLTVQEADREKTTLRNTENDTRNQISRINDSMRQLEREKATLNHQLSQLKGAGDTLNIYAPFMQQLKQRIDQAFAQGRFKKKPIGPVGQYVKVTDETWGPAIETVIGTNYLRSFLVDNLADLDELKRIMNEVCRGHRRPDINCSQFCGKIHAQVYVNDTKYKEYHSIFKALEISDPDVANSLIDLRSVESILLVDDNEIIYGLMQDVGKAPKNCSRCINKLADSFHPAPNYKQYSGLNPRQKHRCQLLQVSIKEAQNSTRENIKEIDEKITSEKANLRELQRELQQTLAQMKTWTDLAEAKRREIAGIRRELNSLEEETDNEEFRVRILKGEAATLETEVRKIESKISQLGEETETLRSQVNNAKQEYDEFQKLLNCGEDSDVSRQLDIKKDQLKETVSEKKTLVNRAKESTQKMSIIEERIKAFQQEKEQKRSTVLEEEKRFKVSDHNYEHETRDLETITNVMNKVKRYIKSVEGQLGTSYEEMCLDIKRKEKALNKLEKGIVKITKLFQQYAEWAEFQGKMFNKTVQVRSADVKLAFQGVLNVRKFQGKLSIDHTKQEIKIQVQPTDGGSRSVDTTSLSGGERSYSAVAFIMALWRVTDIPFYSMDEFDVFMDKVNRKFIIDLLLLTAREKPQSQFIFLTPQDTSCVTPSADVAIFQMEEPERTQQLNMAQ